MAGSIIAALLAAPPFYAKNDNTGSEIWGNLRIRDVAIDIQAATTGEPVYTESAAEPATYTSLLSTDIATLKIVQPTHMRIAALCPDISTLSQIVDVFNDQQVTVSITTKNVVAANMAVISVDISHSGENMTSIPVTIMLEQTVAQTSSSFSPAQTSDSSQYGISVQTPNSSLSNVQSLYNKVSSLF